MSWFDQNELPQINSPDDLKRAMEIVKSRFNGHPHKYTRNDYILFINTLYAALMASYSGSGGGSENISAKLTQDLSVNYPLEVGFVESGNCYRKDTPIEFVLRDILTQDIESIKLDSPEIISSEGNAFLDETEISITCSKPDISCIYYTLSNDHGWRIYSTPFVVNNTTTIIAKAVPTYRAGYKYTESDQNTLSVQKVTKTKLKSPIISQNSDYDKSIINIENQNEGIGTILYSDDKYAWYPYTEAIIKISAQDENTHIYAKVSAPSEQYQDSEIKEVTISFKQVPKPKVTIQTGTTSSTYDTDDTIKYNQEDYPEFIDSDTTLDDNYEAIVLYNDNDTFELKEKVVIKTRITMADGVSFRYSEVYTITFEQIEDLIVYSNMIDPVDKTYTIYIYDEYGMPDGYENKTVKMNEAFSLAEFRSSFSDSFKDYHKNKSGYYVKVQDNESVKILCNKQLTPENTEIYQIVPEDGWPISSMQPNNHISALKFIEEESIDDRKMYSYELESRKETFDSSADVLFKITIK